MSPTPLRYESKYGFGFSASLGTYDPDTNLDVAEADCASRVGWKISKLDGGFRAGCACENGPQGQLCNSSLEVAGEGQPEWMQVVYQLQI
jgi:hypothetical protein